MNIEIANTNFARMGLQPQCNVHIIAHLRCVQASLSEVCMTGLSHIIACIPGWYIKILTDDLTYWVSIVWPSAMQGRCAHQHSLCFSPECLVAETWTGCCKQKRRTTAGFAAILLAVLESHKRLKAQGQLCDLLKNTASTERDSGVMCMRYIG